MPFSVTRKVSHATVDVTYFGDRASEGLEGVCWQRESQYHIWVGGGKCESLQVPLAPVPRVYQACLVGAVWLTHVDSGSLCVGRTSAPPEGLAKKRPSSKREPLPHIESSSQAEGPQ